MVEFVSSPNFQESAALSQSCLLNTDKQRLSCLICNHQIDLNAESAFTTFSCNVRAFQQETFKVWRCPDCSTIHCLDVVNLAHYYAKYPFAQVELTVPLKICYGNLQRQLTKHGFSKKHSLLDYGCGSGLFLKHLQQQGFVDCYGYDPYASLDGFGNPEILKKEKFDYILLQDVVEHVDDPNVLFSELNELLAPGGYILIGTPNADHIDLTQSHLSDYYNPIHVPYHLHLYTRQAIEWLGKQQDWKCVDFYDRPYHDTPLFGINARAWNEYQRLVDGTIDAVLEPIKLSKALTSPRFIFYSMFGYWLSLKTEMSILFRKTGV